MSGRYRTKRLSGSLLDRIETMADKSGDCWLWTGRLNTSGYAEFKMNGRKYMAHRAAYEALVGPIPDGHQLDHQCHNRDKSCAGGASCRHRRCVNPAHLEPATNKENALRGESFAAVNARKTHCPQGHPYDQANTYINPSGARVCRTCVRARQRRYKAERRAAA